MIYKFADCILDCDRHVLIRAGEDVHVEPQVFDLLRLLVENAGRLVSKDAIVDVVWGGRIISEATISARINAARAAVGDTGAAQKIIKTVPRRGFELVAKVSAIEAPRPSEATLPKQTIRYATSPDGTSIAWSTAGDGPPLLFAWHHLSHLEKDWSSALLRGNFAAVSERHRVIRYDIRGSGLSDPIQDADTLDQHVEDMIAVADAAGLESFPVVAVLQSAAVVIRLAARYPDRVSRLVLHNAYARGRAIRGGAAEAPEHDPFIALLNSGGWGDVTNGFMRAWMTMTLPSASFEETTEAIELIAHSGSTRDALVQRGLIDHLDVTDDLALVQCPTLVIHARLCPIHPVSEGRRVAAGIPDAEFLEIDSANAFPIASDPGFERQWAATLDFLDRA